MSGSRLSSALAASRSSGSAPAAVLWPLALTALGNLVYRTYFLVRDDVDFRALYAGATRFAEGASVYADPYFLLTPSGLLVVTPFGELRRDTAFAVWNTLSIAAVLVGLALAVRFVGASLRGPVAAGALLALCLSESLVSTWMFGNLNNSLLLASGAGYLLAEARGRRTTAGLLLGCSLAVKPVLVLLLLIPLVNRRWRTLGWAVALPAVLNVVGLALTPHPEDFFDVTVPALLRARPDFNSSLWAIDTFLGVPDAVTTVARVAVLGLAVLALVWLRGVGDPVQRLATSYGVLLLATFLSASLSEKYYSLLLVPALLAVVRPGSAMTSPLAWLAVYLFGSTDRWIIAGHPLLTARLTLPRGTVGWVLLFAVLVCWAVRHRARRSAALPEQVTVPEEDATDVLVLGGRRLPVPAPRRPAHRALRPGEAPIGVGSGGPWRGAAAAGKQLHHEPSQNRELSLPT